MGTGPRAWSVYPVWITGAPGFEYAKVQALEGSLAVGARVSIQRAQPSSRLWSDWQPGRVVERPDVSDGLGGATVWITLGECG